MLPPELQTQIDLDGADPDFSRYGRELDELPDALRAEIERGFEDGCALIDEGRHLEAARAFRAAIEQLPQPRFSWSSVVMLLTGYGDALWWLGEHTAGLPVWRDVLLYGGLGNPFVHLRRGQTLYELGNFRECANELLRALLLGGDETFAGEDPRYLAYIASQARPPEGQDSWEGWPGLSEDSPMYEYLMDPGKYELFSAPEN